MGILLCIGYKWYGEKETHCISVHDFKGWEKHIWDGRKILKAFLKVYESADMVVTYNGKMFDQKWINGKLWSYGMELLPPVPHVDLYQIAKVTLNASRKSLKNLAYVGGFKEAKEEVAWSEWMKAISCHLPSLRAVVKHCRADLKVTEEMYTRLRPYVRQHPKVAGPASEPCPVCAGTHFHRRGRYISTMKTERFRAQCQGCGHWVIRAK